MTSDQVTINELQSQRVKLQITLVLIYFSVILQPLYLVQNPEPRLNTSLQTSSMKSTDQLLFQIFFIGNIGCDFLILCLTLSMVWKTVYFKLALMGKLWSHFGMQLVIQFVFLLVNAGVKALPIQFALVQSGSAQGDTYEQKQLSLVKYPYLPQIMLILSVVSLFNQAQVQHFAIDLGHPKWYVISDEL